MRGGRYGPPVDVSRLPPYVPAAFVAIEDRRFYEHSGFDAMGMARAALADIGQGRASQGASTITQQLARNLFLSADRTMERKATELVYAVELEQTYSKNQILGLYLSRVYFGSGAYGLEAAAQRYFNKPAARLSMQEAAMLAAIPKSPTAYDPAEQPDRLGRARAPGAGRHGGDRRHHAGRAGQGRWPDAARLQGRPGRRLAIFHRLDGRADPARSSLRRSSDLVVETTLDLPAEAAAGERARAVVERYAAPRAGQAALVALDGAGRMRVMVGGVDYAAAPYNRAVQAHRQAGSAWKPFVYLTAMEAGRTPDSLAVDEPVTIDGWSPRDFEPEFLGQITLETALAHSINTVAARLADEIGRPRVAATARRLGIVSPINTDPAMALGTTLVTPLEMAQAYDAFSNGGERVNAYGLESIRVDGRRGDLATPADARPAGHRQSAAERDGPDASHGDRLGHRRACGHSRPRHRRQDRHHLRFQGRLVLRLHRRPHHRGVDRPRRQRPHARDDRRQRAGGALARLHDVRLAAPALPAIPPGPPPPVPTVPGGWSQSGFAANHGSANCRGPACCRALKRAWQLARALDE